MYDRHLNAFFMGLLFLWEWLGRAATTSGLPPNGAFHPSPEERNHESLNGDQLYVFIAYPLSSPSGMA